MQISIPHLIARKARLGRLRYYWQPSALLRGAGWQPVGLGHDLEAAARAARAINDQVREWRAGKLAPAGGRAARRQVSPYAAPLTLRQLIHSFLADCQSRVRPSTLKQYRSACQALDTWAGDQPLTYITAERCRVLLRALATPAKPGSAERLHRAAGIGRVLRTLLGFAVDHERLAANPMDRVIIRDAPPRHHIWPDHAIDSMMAMADHMGLQSIGTATLLAADTGQREADLLRLTWAKLPATAHGRAIRLRQGKTMQWIEVKLTRRLQARLDALEAANRQAEISGTTVLHTPAGQPWRQEAFIRTFAQVRAATAAGDAEQGLAPCPELAELQYRDLRRTLIVRLAEAGVELPGIAAVSGHKIEVCKKILETYLPRTGKMAAAAITQLETHRGSPEKLDSPTLKVLDKSTPNGLSA